MYIPKNYQAKDSQKIYTFLKSTPFAILVSVDAGKPVATHIPAEVRQDGGGNWVIYSHMARANPQWKTMGGQEVLMIFLGANSYISPRWYNHVNVPTWNYQSVHLYGQVRFLEGQELVALFSRLIVEHEPSTAYRLETLPPDFVQKEMAGTVGFAIDVTRVEAAFKLSQNRNDEDHASIIRQLEQRGDENSLKIARAMRKNRPGEAEK